MTKDYELPKCMILDIDYSNNTQALKNNDPKNGGSLPLKNTAAFRVI